jgi:hypothetical protein
MSRDPCIENASLRPEHADALTSVSLGQPRTFPDPLYGTVRVAAWAAGLLATSPLRRLAGVSLSDVPGDLLFGRPFPSRLDHTLGVYHLARLACPRDRALQAAALAHDLGHGPFSHLTEPLMRERLGADHEERSVWLLAEVRAALTPSAARLTAWLDWDEMAQLMLGRGNGGRGALLNGLVDYDNADNVARFLLCSGLGTPGYDPVALARALCLLPPEPVNGMDVPGSDAHAGRAASDVSLFRTAPADRVYLRAQAEDMALGWQRDRAAVYRYLHEGHHNLAAHAMLRKAVDLAAAADLLPASFFDMTDETALRLLASAPEPGIVALARAAHAGADHVYRCVWEAEVSSEAADLPTLFGRWRERLALEARLAREAGLAPHEVVLEVLASGAYRALPPLATLEHSLAFTRQADPPLTPPRMVHLFAPLSAGQDYVRRLRMAAERRLGVLGAMPRSPDVQTGPPVLHFKQGS